jgi:hypothetical protein
LPPASQRWSPNTQRDLLIGAYYDCLNSDPGFQEALRKLFDCLDALLEAEDRDVTARILYGPATQAWALLPGAEAMLGPGHEHHLRAQVDELLTPFIAEWHLPPAVARTDLRGGYAVKSQAGNRLKRRISPLSPEDSPVVFGRLPAPGRRPWHPLPAAEPIISPQPPLPFRYDPLTHDRTWLQEKIDDICREIRESVLGQAQEYERQLEPVMN